MSDSNYELYAKKHHGSDWRVVFKYDNKVALNLNEWSLPATNIYNLSFNLKHVKLDIEF